MGERRTSQNQTKSDTHVEGELSREVVHAAGVHEAERVAHRLRAQHALTRDGAEAAVGQRGRHDAGALAGHLDGAQLAAVKVAKAEKNRASQRNEWSSVFPVTARRHTSVTVS